MISVLIPAYNVAPYIGACLDSVLENAADKEIEVVVCVDVRSTDATASIVREYAARDARLRVAEDGLAGVGRLRNRTLELARGKLLMFVDADDLLPHGSIDALLNAMTDDVDAVFGRLHASRTPRGVRQIDGCEAAEAILYQRRLNNGLHCSLWAKLWRADVWRTVRFPEDILYEDLATVPLVTARCRSIALVDDAVYYYRQRTGSILNTFTTLRFSSVRAAAILVEQAPNAGFARAARNRQLSAAFNVLRLMMRYRRSMTPAVRRAGMEIALPVIRAIRSETLVDPHSRLSLRLAALVFRF